MIEHELPVLSASHLSSPGASWQCSGGAAACTSTTHTPPSFTGSHSSPDTTGQRSSCTLSLHSSNHPHMQRAWLPLNTLVVQPQQTRGERRGAEKGSAAPELWLCGGGARRSVHVVHHHIALHCPATQLRRYSESADSSVSESEYSSEYSSRSQPESYSEESSE